MIINSKGFFLLKTWYSETFLKLLANEYVVYVVGSLHASFSNEDFLQVGHCN